jgi:hypothetical protein
MQSGTRLGPYEILEPLGAGGMGEVYRAPDTRLGRQVAVKVLPPAFASDAERLARFEQEARASAALNHPHIAQVFDVGSADAVEGDAPTTHFIVQELLSGRSLREELEAGRMPIRRVLELGTEMAEALGAAHSAGITHRDLKPENVFITGDGHAKLLDFGLAKLTEVAAASSPDATMSPTLLGTMVGQVLGTAGYMSPEQIDGQPGIDHRADLFAFGAVLYEMATGQRAFAGRSVADTLSRIQHDEPAALAELDPKLPYDLQRLVAKALVKDPADRYQHAADLVVDLRSLRRASESGAIAAPPRVADRTEKPRTAGRAVSPALAAAVAVALGAAGWWLGNREADADRDRLGTDAAEAHFVLELPEGAVGLPRGQGQNLAITPDGGSIAMVVLRADGTRHVVQRRLDMVGWEPRGHTSAAIEPAYSHDGAWLSYGVGFTTHYRVQAEGGESFPVCESCVDASWGDDGAYYYIGAGSLYRARGEADEPERVLDPPAAMRIPYMSRPILLPGSAGVVVEVGNYQRGGIAAIRFADEHVVSIANNGSSPQYVDPGYILFARDSSIFAVAFDPVTFEVGSEIVPVLQGVRVENGGAAQFAIANDGTAVFSPALGEQQTALALVNRQGDVEQIVGPRGTYSTPRVSPDGRALVAVVNESGRSDLLRLDLESGGQALLTTSGSARSPTWSSDSSWLAFGAASGQDGFGIFRLDPRGLGTRELYRGEFPLLPTAITPDGAYVIFIDTGADDIFRIPVDGEPDGKLPEPVLQSRWSEESAVLSPDGALIAFESDRTGDREIYVHDLSSGRELQVTVTGGTEPAWSRSGDELFFRDVPNSQWALSRIERQPDLIVSRPETMFSATPYWQGLVNSGYDTMPDGRFVFVRHRDPSDPPDEVHVIMNFLGRLPR